MPSCCARYPIPEPSKLIEIGRASSRGVESVTYPDYQRWREGTRSFSSIGAYFQNTGISRITFKLGDEPEGGKAGFVSASFFEVMGVPPRLGRVFTTSEEQSGEPVAVLSHTFWQRRLAGSEAIGNLTLNINGLSYRVIGVMPPTFAWPAPDLIAWIPITQTKSGSPCRTHSVYPGRRQAAHPEYREVQQSPKSDPYIR